MADMGKDNVIIFGGSGFLGSHVADAYSDAGFMVKIFDLAESPYLRSDQEMILGNIMDFDAVCKATDGCRYILNFAGIAGIGDANDNPPVTAQINVVGAVNTLEAARMARIERYLFASTVYVYTRYGAMYKASKQAAECFIETYQEEYKLDYTVLRYGTLYGRRSDERNRIYNFLEAAYKTGKIEYEGSIDAIREFIHVTDAAKLTLRALDVEYKNRHLILTGQEKMTIGDLLRVIGELMPGEIQWSCAKEDTTKHYMITPYSFQPRLGHKLVPDDFVDLGQGLLDCLTELMEKYNGIPEKISAPTKN